MSDLKFGNQQQTAQEIAQENCHDSAIVEICIHVISGGWVSADEAKPKPGEEVLLKIDGAGHCVGSYDLKYNGCWRIGNDSISWDYDYSFGGEVDVTHWKYIK